MNTNSKNYAQRSIKNTNSKNYTQRLIMNTNSKKLHPEDNYKHKQ